MLERNRNIYPVAVKTHTRNAVLSGIFALVFLVFGMVQERGTFLSSFLLALAGVMAIGSIFSIVSGRRLARLSKTRGPDANSVSGS